MTWWKPAAGAVIGGALAYGLWKWGFDAQNACFSASYVDAHPGSANPAEINADMAAISAASAKCTQQHPVASFFAKTQENPIGIFGPMAVLALVGGIVGHAVDGKRGYTSNAGYYYARRRKPFPFKKQKKATRAMIERRAKWRRAKRRKG